MLFIDDDSPFEYPQNVKVIYTSFEETVKQFQQHYDFPVNLKTPYQLCEFKIAYGEVYSTQLVSYDFWGYCDIDLLFGNLRHFITDAVLEKYNKISWRGHLTLFKNTAEISSFYRKNYRGFPTYRVCLGNFSNYPCYYEERLINNLFEENGMGVYTQIPFADLKIRSFNFELLHFNKSEDYKNDAQIFVWRKGNLKRLFVRNGKIWEEDFAYIHFLKRPVTLANAAIQADGFIIVPNAILPFTEKITLDKILKWAKQKMYWSYIFSRLNLKYLRNKMAYSRSKKLFEKANYGLPADDFSVVIPGQQATAYTAE